MKLKNTSLREMDAYPWRAANQQPLVQVSKLLTSANGLPSAGMEDGGVVLGVVGQMMQEQRCLEAWIR